MKKTVLKKVLLALVALMMVNYGCTKDDIEDITVADTSDSILEKSTSTLSIYENACGVKLDNTDKNNDDSKSRRRTLYHTYSADRLFTPEQAVDIKVFSDIGSITGSWSTFVDNAISSWNQTHIVNTCINLRRVYDIHSADIIIRDGPTAYASIPGHEFPSGHFGLEVPASDDNPVYMGTHHSNVYINTSFKYGSGSSAMDPTINQKRHIIVHELGHSLGFHHQSDEDFYFGGYLYNTIPGITFNESSIMFSGIVGNSNDSEILTPSDVQATDYVYDCDDGVFNDLDQPQSSITLFNIRPFCFSTDTFTARGNFSNVDGGATTIQLCFTENTGGLSGSQCVIQDGGFTGGNFTFENIDLNSIPGFTFNPSNTYTLSARIVGAGSTTTSDSIDLQFDDCDVSSCSLSDFNPITGPNSSYVDLDTGIYTVIYGYGAPYDTLSWDDIDTEYTLEFTVLNGLPNAGYVYTVNTLDNAIDINTVVTNTMSFAWTARIRSRNCSWSETFHIYPPW